MGSELRIIPINDVNREESYRVLARAFADDPVIRWLVSDPGRDVALFRFLDRVTHGAPDSCDLALDGDRAVGAAYWDPPGHKQSVWTAVSSFPLLLNIFRTRVRRAGEVEHIFGKLRPKEPHWYLSTIGAIESGRGIGTSLLHHRLDTMTGPAYLESSKRENVPLYERFGFEVTEVVTLPGGGPQVWPMYRPAR
ncbi:putative acetyltransferase [Gordonia effusa NBRC 100432]|uniref:Putative acetyltransferase n=1 Tax=Gordonia effusa NBRC 100432 TaxID=1077974 RepID=H0QY43_9ACTN|nr:GNAT family N-acetyltransferase [Gordonia effusa]GAB17744.1 putative acetyltransferase [Gordonia effusa NBRC 100432]